MKHKNRLLVVATAACMIMAVTACDKGDITMDEQNLNVTATEAASEAPVAPSEAPSAVPSTEPSVAPSGVPEEADYSIKELCPPSVAQTRFGVNYGEFVHDTYYSNTCGMERGYNYLLPVDYSENREYPVMYILHGIFGDENSMLDAGNKIKEIFGNMAADGLSEDWILVFPNMYARTKESEVPKMDDPISLLPYDSFINDFADDLIPYINSKFSVKEGRENVALSGFSMGGRETLYIACKRPDLFAYACAISPAPGLTPGQDWAMVHPGQLSEEELVFATDENKLTVLMDCCGTKDGVVGTFPKSYHEIMERNGVEHIWFEITGADHNATAIKSGYYNFLTQIAYSKTQQ